MELNGGDASSHGDHARIGIVTVSDRAHQGVYGVAGAEAMVGFLHEAVRSSWDAVLETVPDERDRIEEVLIRLVDDEACSIIVTTGGTGPAPRDVTPEATEAVCDRILPGFGEQMRAISLRFACVCNPCLNSEIDYLQLVFTICFMTIVMKIWMGLSLLWTLSLHWFVNV